MSSYPQCAFVDEFGDPNLDLSIPGVSSHFLVSAVIVDEHKISGLKKQLELIRKRHFQTGEMKSSKVGDNNARRKKILNEIASLDFHIYAMVFSKKELTSQGVHYKKSFLKFLHSRVDRELFKTFPVLTMTADEHGSHEFMVGFQDYIKERHIPNLFRQSSFGFSASRPSLLLQLADFVCGTIARCFDRTVKSPMGEEFLHILRQEIIAIIEWPARRAPYIYDYTSRAEGELNRTIAELSVNLANQFVADMITNTDAKVGLQIRCLKFLLFHYHFIDPTKYVSTAEIVRNIYYDPQIRGHIRHFRSVIASLRDQGVLISSSPRGYKLPVNEDDLYDFVNQTNTVVRPMIARILKCRNRTYLATKKQLDILDKPEFAHLKTVQNQK